MFPVIYSIYLHKCSTYDYTNYKSVWPARQKDTLYTFYKILKILIVQRQTDNKLWQNVKFSSLEKKIIISVKYYTD